MSKALQQTDRQAAESMRRLSVCQDGGGFPPCLHPARSQAQNKRFFLFYHAFNRRAVIPTWFISLLSLFEKSMLCLLSFSFSLSLSLWDLLFHLSCSGLFFFFLSFHVNCSASRGRHLKQATHFKEGNLIRFNSSPISRHCFYVFCKYLFGTRYALWGYF